MRAEQKKILVVGLFLSERNRQKILRTAADQLAEMFARNGIEIIKVSAIVYPLIRLIDTIFTIVLKVRQYSVAIVPLYGTPLSFFWADASTLLLKLLQKKVVLILHGGSIPERMEANPAKFLRIIKRADKVVCPSAYLQTVIEKYGIQSCLIENVISKEDYTFNPKETFRPRLLWMRTFHDIYNPEMAVRVAALLAQKYNDFEMVMAGYDRGSLAATRQLIEANSLAKKIKLPGYISNEEKNHLAKDYDIYLCTNRIDNAPVSVIEMMNLGLPVVSVNSGGLPYLISDGETGQLVNMDDDEAMADAITRIIENPAYGKKLAANGLRFAAQFSEEQVLLKWKILLSELLATTPFLPSELQSAISQA